MEQECWTCIWFPPNLFFPFADFAFYPFAIINHSGECDYMLSPVSSASKPESSLWDLTHLAVLNSLPNIFPTTLWSRYYYVNSTDRESKVQRGVQYIQKINICSVYSIWAFSNFSELQNYLECLLKNAVSWDLSHELWIQLAWGLRTCIYNKHPRWFLCK